MKKNLFSLCLSLVILFEAAGCSHVSAVFNQKFIMTPVPKPTIFYVLPYPGILPDHPLYFLKNIRDKMVVMFKNNPVKKSQIYLLLSDKNLVMGKTLWEKEQFEYSVITLSKSVDYMKSSVDTLTKLNIKDVPPGATDKIILSIDKHAEIIQELIDRGTGGTYISRLKEILISNNQAKRDLSSIR
jgi:hypothetical protein